MCASLRKFGFKVPVLARSNGEVVNLRERLRHSQAKTVFRSHLDLSGKVEVSSSVVVTLDKRAHNPYLVASGLTNRDTPMPWFGDKKPEVEASG
jgi:hypothetical protein